MQYRKPREKQIPKEMYKGFYILPQFDGGFEITNPYGDDVARRGSVQECKQFIDERLKRANVRYDEQNKIRPRTCS